VAIHAGLDRRGLTLCAGGPEIEETLAAAGLSLDPRALPLGYVVAVADLVESDKNRAHDESIENRVVCLRRRRMAPSTAS
jgi:hypothetical protein